MTWKIGMKDEKDGRVLLTEGIYEAEIMTVQLVSAEKSKSKNPYFKWELKTDEGNINVITTLLKGKRWLLKQMLSACGIESNPEDLEQKYEFSEKDVQGKKVKIKIVNKENSFTGSDGNLINFIKSEVQQIMELDIAKETSETETKEVPF